MKNHHPPRVERFESRQFLSAGPERPDGAFAGAAGAAGAETDEIESAGHRLDFLAPARRATGDGPPDLRGEARSFSLHEALREMAAAFEQEHGCDLGSGRREPLPWPGRSSLGFGG